MTNREKKYNQLIADCSHMGLIQEIISDSYDRSLSMDEICNFLKNCKIDKTKEHCVHKDILGICFLFYLETGENEGNIYSKLYKYPYNSGRSFPDNVIEQFMNDLHEWDDKNITIYMVNYTD